MGNNVEGSKEIENETTETRKVDSDYVDADGVNEFDELNSEGERGSFEKNQDYLIQEI